MRYVSAWMLLGLLAACGGPLWGLPGGRLAGNEAPFDASVLPGDGGVMALETRPRDPYSVNVGYVVIGGRIYIDPASERNWYQHMLSDPAVRIRIEGAAAVHPMVAVPVASPDILERFDAQRQVFRLDPR